MIGQYPPLGLPTGSRRWIIRKRPPRTAACDGCLIVKNRLSLYRTSGLSRACRTCARIEQCS
jgi:hypothetical protein